MTERFLGVPVKSGEMVRVRVPVAEFSDGSPVTIPVVTAGGTHDGPTLFVQAGIHGDELTGIEICRRFLSQLDLANLHGTVVAVPVANVPSHQTRSRGFMNEERILVDMNRIWPGNPNGLLTERLADVLFHGFISHADLTVDLHSALDGCDISPFVYIWPDDDENGTLQARRDAASAFGVKVYHQERAARFGTSVVSGSLAIQADAAGKAVILAEMGESRRVSTQFVQTGVDGLNNVMRRLGMVQSIADEPREGSDFFHFAVVHAGRGGGLRMHVDLESTVSAGQEIGEIVDVFGETTERLVAPVDGFILRIMRLGSVATGAEVAWVAY